MKPRLRAEELTGMISLLRDKFVRIYKNVTIYKHNFIRNNVHV